LKISELIQESDWRSEKHVPVVDCPDTVKKDEYFEVTAAIGKEIAHPNTTAHHISWITLYFLPEGEKFPYQIAKCDFTAHGASVQGPDTSTVYTNHKVTASMKTSKPGTIFAESLCNIHGLWQFSKPIKVE
jgi:superoxide reductase